MKIEEDNKRTRYLSEDEWSQTLCECCGLEICMYTIDDVEVDN